jgi:hypothetical protein
MTGTTNIIQRKIKFSPKKYMFSILKLKGPKIRMGATHTDFFSRDRQNFQAALKLLENIPEHTKENKIKAKLILIYTVFNKKIY